MSINVNGKQMTLTGPCTVARLLEELNLGDAACAVEVNRQLVPKRNHEHQLLEEHDVVEIVTLVGGG